MPEPAAGGDVAPLRRVDGIEVPGALAALGVLAVGDEDLVLPDHRRGDDLVARLGPDRILGIGVELPQLLAGERLITAHPAIAFTNHRLHYAADGAHRRRGPLPVQDSIAGVTHLPRQLAGVLIDRDHGWRLGSGYAFVVLIPAVGGADENQAAIGRRRGSRLIVRRHAELLDHVERPDDLAAR